MQKLRFFTVLLLLAVALPAFAVNKDMVQLQTQIQQLQDAVARLQQSNDERMGVLKDLIQQSADSVNRMSVNMDSLKRQLDTGQMAQGGKVDTVSGQVQALNDSLDEMKARMNRLEKALGNVQNDTQNINAAIQNLPQNAGPATTTVPQAVTQPAVQQEAPRPLAAVTPALAAPLASEPRPGVVRAPAAAVDALYNSAYADYMSAKYAVATSEFGEVIHAYPDHPLSGNSYYYLGEIDYRAGKYAAAAKDYDKVLEQFPDSNKIPASHLHKGQALIALKQNEAGVRELRTLIQRFPASPEAAQARSKLSGMGVPVKPRA